MAFRGKKYRIFRNSNLHETSDSYRAPVDTCDTSSDWRRKTDVPATPVTGNDIFKNYKMKSHLRKKIKCKHSYGIICKRYNRDEYLAIHRLHSIGLEELMRCNWELYQFHLIHMLCDDMTLGERKMLSDIENFKILWSSREWGQYVNYEDAEKKMKQLINGYWYDSETRCVMTDEECSAISSKSGESASTSGSSGKLASVTPIVWVTWQKICDMCCTQYEKLPLEFPKGKRNKKGDDESYLECAKREFLEETNIGGTSYTLLDAPPIKEKFIGIDGARYIYTYYVAEMKPDADDRLFIDVNNVQQMSEISEINWYTKEQIHSLVRPYNYTRKLAFEDARKYFDKKI